MVLRGHDFGEQRQFERTRRLDFPPDESRRVAAVTLALERHLRVHESHLAVLQRAQARLADAAKESESECVMEILTEVLDQHSLFGLARLARCRW